MKIFTSNHFWTHVQRETEARIAIRLQIAPRSPQTQIVVRLRLRIAPRSHPLTSPVNPKARIARLRLRRLRTPLTSPRWHRYSTDHTEIAIEKWLGFDEFDRIWWIFFGWVLMNLTRFVFIYWEMVLYICLEVEKMWETRRKCVSILFLATPSNIWKYFPKHFLECNQTLENIFLSWK